MSNEAETDTGQPTKTSADYKELGNKAFAERDYQTAIAHYTKGIQLEPNNHIFFSNRSASYAGLKEWEHSMDDAKQCIRLDPTFIKGYYRLATAQLETKHYDAAEATIKQGLSLDADNSQLSKTLRTIKQAQKAASSSPTASVSALASSLTTGPNGGSRHLDVAVAQELHDLKLQHSKTSQEYSSFQASLNKAQREENMYGLTLQELQENPPATGNFYRTVGKVFVKSSQPQILKHLETNVATQQTKQHQIKVKLEYLEKRLKSQRLNMKELTS